MELETNNTKSFEKNSTISLAIVILGSGMGGIFQILSGRIINDVSLYADLNTLFSLQTILVLPTTIITYVITKYIAEFCLHGQNAEMKSFLQIMVKPLAVLAVLVLMLGICFSSYISEMLHIENQVLINLAIANAAVSFLLPLVNGTLQGMQLFLAYGLISLFGQGFKLLGMFFAGLSSYKLESIMILVLSGTIFSIFYGFTIVQKRLRNVYAVKSRIKWKAITGYVLSVLWANIALTLLTNMDMILVKQYFNADAGFYSVALVLGRLVYYFASAIAVVLFPMAVTAEGANKEAFRLLSKSIAYNSILALAAIMVLNLGGKYIVQMCYGELYLDAVQYILPITCMIFPVNIITLIINFLLAQNRGNHIIGVTLAGIGAEAFCVSFSQHNLLITVWIMAAILWITLGIDAALLLKIKRDAERDE